jgi:hypothetical protein
VSNHPELSLNSAGLSLSDAAGISSDDAFGALSHARRRHVVDCLRGRDSTSLTALADDVAARERRAEVDANPDAETVAVSLYHVHVPKLADAGLVVYDPGQRTVRLSERAESLVPVFASAAD